MADTDLTQYDGSPAFPSTVDVGTSADPYLVPTDGKFVTASSNLADEAPVNRALERVKDLLLGLRGSLIGDFAGASRKTVYSLWADGSGGLANALPAGCITADSDITSSFGSVTSVNGDVNAQKNTSVIRAGSDPGQVAEHRVQKYAFRNTTTGSSTSANPPQGTVIANELRAINIPKVSAFIVMSPGTISSFDGHGVLSCALDGAATVQVNFAANFDNTRYTVKTGAVWDGTNLLLPVEIVGGRTTAHCRLMVWNITTGSFVDFTVLGVNFSVSVDGQQTT